jgi:hypothetical protein
MIAALAAQEYANGGSLLTELEKGWLVDKSRGDVNMVLVLQVS